MTIKFKIRVTRKVQDGDLVPIYIRLLDGRFYDKTEKTALMVNPYMWDTKGECIKSRVLYPEEERKKLQNSIADIRNFIANKYLEEKSRLSVFLITGLSQPLPLLRKKA